VKLSRSGAFLLVSTVLVLGGCSHPQVPRSTTSTVFHAAELEYWSLRAKVSVTHGEESWSGTLRWHHLASGEELTIRDPIGRTRLRASSRPNGNLEKRAQLQIAGQPEISGPNLESLLRSATNLYLPFEQLPSWVSGRDSPEQAAQTTTDSVTGRITQIEQAGWTINYPEYQIQDSLELPRKIFLSNHSTYIRMVITRWQLIAQQ